jgi:trans-AT polyketide synthase, acyltransferase and oxidoreductase domains
VRWTESIRYLMGKGAPTFEELRPGNVLTRLIADIQRTATPLVVEDEPHPDAAPRPHSRPVTVPATQPTKASSPAPAPHLPKITPEQLGSEEFKHDYGLHYAYASGAMYKGIAPPRTSSCGWAEQGF